MTTPEKDPNLIARSQARAKVEASLAQICKEGIRTASHSYAEVVASSLLNEIFGSRPHVGAQTLQETEATTLGQQLANLHDMLTANPLYALTEQDEPDEEFPRLTHRISIVDEPTGFSLSVNSTEKSRATSRRQQDSNVVTITATIPLDVTDIPIHAPESSDPVAHVSFALLDNGGCILTVEAFGTNTGGISLDEDLLLNCVVGRDPEEEFTPELLLRPSTHIPLMSTYSKSNLSLHRLSERDGKLVQALVDLSKTYL